MFVDLLNKKLYITTNEGQSFAHVSVTFSPDSLLFHPAEEDRLLAYAASDRTVSYFLLHPYATFRVNHDNNNNNSIRRRNSSVAEEHSMSVENNVKFSFRLFDHLYR